MVDKLTKPHLTLKEKDIPNVLLKLLKSNGKEEINLGMLEHFLNVGERMLYYFEKYNNMKIIGSSILLMVDNIS